MSRTDTFRFVETEDFQAVELPYRGSDLSLVVVLPKPDVKAETLSTTYQRAFRKVFPERK